MAGDKRESRHTKDIKKSLLDIVLWQCGYFNDKDTRPKPPAEFSYPKPLIEVEEREPTVNWINHSTFLVSVDGVNILTDPIWGERCSPVPFIGPKRRHPPSISIEDLPHIHVVIVSHDHYDHLCRASVKKLHARFPHILWITPKGLKPWFAKFGITNVYEHEWWEHSTHHFDLEGIEISFTAVQSQHFSGRLGWHSNKTGWAGFVAEFGRKCGNHKRLYFVGDTGYNKQDFKKIGERFESMDLSLIPIGTYVPYEFMAPVHICPEHAVDIHTDVGSKLSVGMHWKTFKLSSEGMDQPPFDLYREMEKRNMNPHKFLPLEPGEKMNW